MKILLSILITCSLVIGCMSANKPTYLFIDDLRSTDRETRLSAAWLLGQRGKEAVPALIETLNDTDKGIQYASIYSLATINTLEAKEALIKVLPILDIDLNTEDKEWKKTTVELLQIIGSPEAHAILKKHGIE